MSTNGAASCKFDQLSVEELQEILISNEQKLQALAEEIRTKNEQIDSYKIEVEWLKMQLVKLRRMQFGQKSEKIGKEIEQIELLLEDIEATQSQHAAADEKKQEKSPRSPAKPRMPRVFPANLPRERRVLAPTHEACPDCGGAFTHLGETVSETLDIEPIHFKVIQYVRPKLACTKCDVILQEPAAPRPIERGIPEPGLLAHVLVGKYIDHMPLYRQSEAFSREGIDLDRSLLADWVGSAAALLAPLGEALRKHVFASAVVHADDTPISVLAPGNGKTKTGRLWTYVRDERPAAGKEAPAVWFSYAPDRKGIHPQRHAEDFSGIFQADGYSGFSKIYDNGRVFEAACWAHVRRKFFDLSKAQKSPIAKEALERIAALYAIEDAIRGKPAEQRREIRYEKSRPLVDAMKKWMEEQRKLLSQKSQAAKAIHYALARWKALTRYCDDGRIEVDNNAAERALRCVALGRKNYLFAGSDVGGERAAVMYSLLGSAKLNGCNPQAYLREVLARIPEHPIARIAELLPWNLQIAEPKKS